MRIDLAFFEGFTREFGLNAWNEMMQSWKDEGNTLSFNKIEQRTETIESPDNKLKIRNILSLSHQLKQLICYRNLILMSIYFYIIDKTTQKSLIKQQKRMIDMQWTILKFFSIVLNKLKHQIKQWTQFFYSCSIDKHIFVRFLEKIDTV